MKPHKQIPEPFQKLWDWDAPTPARRRLMAATKALSACYDAEDDARDRFHDFQDANRSSHGCDLLAYFDRWRRAEKRFSRVWRRSEVASRAQAEAALDVVREIVADLPPGTCLTTEILRNLEVQLVYDPRVNWVLHEIWREECAANAEGGAPPFAVLQ